MNHQPPPLITVPLDLSDEAAAQWLEFLHEITHRFEGHYADLLDRYRHRTDPRQPDLWTDTDPPFWVVIGTNDRQLRAPLFAIYPRFYAAVNSSHQL